jgi:hypothetical protein
MGDNRKTTYHNMYVAAFMKQCYGVSMNIQWRMSVISAQAAEIFNERRM